MEYALSIENLGKKFDDFNLDSISMHVPYGSIVGLVGENGAGKSTIINTLLGFVKHDYGQIRIFGVPVDQMNVNSHEKIGIVLDCNCYHDTLAAKQIEKIMRLEYRTWDSDLFYSIIKKFNLPEKKLLRKYSLGMRRKFSLAVALAHKPQLLILDEVLSGLDPVIRDEMLDVFLEFVQDSHNSILISSHVINDLEKFADYISFLKDGKIVFFKTKDDIINNFCLVQCSAENYQEIDPRDVLASRKLDYCWQVLMQNREAIERKYNKMVVEPITLEEIILIYGRSMEF